MDPRDNQHKPEVIDQPVDFEFMSPSDWLEFNCELYDVVDCVDLDVDRVESGVIVLAGGTSIGLLSLAQHCHLQPREDWAKLIAEHLEAISARMTSLVHDHDEPLSMFDLRVRLVPDDPADHGVFGALGARPFAPGVVQFLAVDVPGGIRPVPEKEIDDLGWDADEAWGSAWAQTEALEQPEEINVIDVGGADILHVFGERPFTASLVNVIDDVIGPFPADGAIVSIPAGHSVLVHPVESADEARTAINALIPITRQLHRQGPSSVSPHLYWWCNGRLQCIPTYFASDGIEAYLPPDLSDALLRR